MARAYLFIVGVSAGLGLLSGGAAADGMPTPGVVVAPERSWSLEVGARYWYSVGRNKYDYFNDPTPTQLNSRLTYDGTHAQSGEGFVRLDHRSGLFVKGFFGAGTISDGTLFDEDFPPALAPYSKTSSSLEGGLRYFTADLGYTFYDSTRTYRGGVKDGAAQHGFRLGGFVGYNYWNEKQDAYGCTQLAANPFVCPPGAVLPGDKVITERDRWNSLRLGLVADAMLTDRLKLTGEAAYLRADQKALDIHHFTFGPDPASGDGSGFQLEAVLAYQLTSHFNLGVGARWWHMNTEAIDSVNQLLKYDTDRYGFFAQGSLKLN